MLVSSGVGSAPGSTEGASDAAALGAALGAVDVDGDGVVDAAHAEKARLATAARAASRRDLAGVIPFRSS